jgi:hypothetical protein
MLLNIRKESATTQSLRAQFRCRCRVGAIVNQVRPGSQDRCRPALGRDANLDQKVTLRGDAIESAIVPYSAAAQTVTLDSNKY